MSDRVHPKDLLEWCRIPAPELPGHPKLRVPFRLVADSAEMGRVMARELVDTIAARNNQGLETRAIVPCGPSAWYAPWTEEVNSRRVSLARLIVFHMDECLDWQGKELPRSHPYSFRGEMDGIGWIMPSDTEGEVKIIKPSHYSNPSGRISMRRQIGCGRQRK